VVLTLNDAVDLALKEGYDARRLRLDLMRAEQDMASVRRSLLPNLAATLLAPNFIEGVSSISQPNQLPIYNTTGSLMWNSYMTLTQVLPTNGTLTVSSQLQQERQSVFNDALAVNTRTKRFLTRLRVDFRQSLLVPNEQRLRLERAHLELERAQRLFTRDQLNIIYEVTADFYTLYSATRRLEIAREDVAQQEQLFDLARKKFDAGLIPEVQALQVEVDLARSRNALLEAEGNASGAADQFKMTVGLQLSDSVAVRTDFALTPFEVDATRAVEHGLKHRAEIRNDEISRRLAEIRVRQEDARTAIKGTLNAYYDRTGVSDPFLPYSISAGDLFDSSWNDLKRRPRNLGVTFLLTVPIWDWGVNRAEVASARAALDQSELAVGQRRIEVERQIRSALTRLREARGRLDVLKKSEAVALRSYEISRARFENGGITAQELADTRDRLNQVRQDNLNAYIRYQISVADLKRQTLYDFENDRSLVTEPK
jgi:outer membrane protein TolC